MDTKIEGLEEISKRWNLITEINLENIDIITNDFKYIINHLDNNDITQQSNQILAILELYKLCLEESISRPNILNLLYELIKDISECISQI